MGSRYMQSERSRFEPSYIFHADIRTVFKYQKAILCKGTAPKSYNLHQLRNVPGKITPESFCEIADRIEYIDSLNLDMDLSSISHNKRKSIARRIVHRRLYSIERSSQEKSTRV